MELFVSLDGTSEGLWVKGGRCSVLSACGSRPQAGNSSAGQAGYVAMEKKDLSKEP